jgi:mono/diheme cytochrome c family protein
MILMALLLATAWPAAAQTQGQGLETEAGRALAAQWCSNCHRVAVAGPGPVADAVPSFAALARRGDLTVESISAFVRLPHAGMPDLSLTLRQSRELAAYLLAQRPQ